MALVVFVFMLCWFSGRRYESSASLVCYGLLNHFLLSASLVCVIATYSLSPLWYVWATYSLSYLPLWMYGYASCTVEPPLPLLLSLAHCYLAQDHLFVTIIYATPYQKNVHYLNLFHLLFMHCNEPIVVIHSVPLS